LCEPNPVCNLLGAIRLAAILVEVLSAGGAKKKDIHEALM
jgi:hypothetical protein